jgi:5-methylthioadenosine/S-adenosylhomocysteine deaminase
MLYSNPANYSQPSLDHIKLRTTLGAAECLLSGITTVQDMPTIVGANHERLDAILAAYEECGARVVLAPQISDRAPVNCVPFWQDLPAAALKMLPKANDVRSLQSLIEERVQRVDFSRMTWALGPSGPQRCTDALLGWTASLAKRHGLQIFTHLYEARSQAVLARQQYDKGSLVEHMAALGLLGPHLTIAHGVWIRDDEIARLGAAEANLSCNPISNMKLLNGFAPVTQYQRGGVTIGLGCDNCSGNDAQSIFQSMKTFALLWGMLSKAGESGAARAAFAAATTGGAKALGLADRIGRLRPGYRADIVLIDLDSAPYRPLNSAVRQLVYSETGAGVHTVIVDGQIVVEDRKLKSIDESALKQRSEAWRESLLAEIDAVGQRNNTVLPDVLAAYERSNRFALELNRLALDGAVSSAG